MSSAPPPPTLKVMRMTSPSLAISSSIELDPSKAFPVTPFLTLPSSFGVLHLGEVFRACICVSDLHGATHLKVEMQVGGVSTELVSKQCEANASTLEVLVSAEIQQLGSHALICSLSWNHGATPEGLRKTYKFESQHPLSVKTKFHKPLIPLARNPNASTASTMNEPGSVVDGWLEVQVSNISTAEIYVQSMDLVPSSGYSVSAIHTSDKGRLLQVKDTFQYAFEISRGGPVGNDWGKLDIKWMTAMGERGRLMTAPLIRKTLPDVSSQSEPIKLIPTLIPAEIVLNSVVPFRFKFEGLSGPLKLQHLDPSLSQSKIYAFAQTPPVTPMQTEQTYPRPIPSRPMPEAVWAEPLGLSLRDVNGEFSVEYFFPTAGLVRLPPLAVFQGTLRIAEIPDVSQVWVSGEVKVDESNVMQSRKHGTG